MSKQPQSSDNTPLRPPAPPSTTREPKYFVEGAEVSVEGTIVTIRFDVSQNIGPSSGGSGSLLVASSRGNQKAFFQSIGIVYLSLNAYFFPPKSRQSNH